MPTSLRCFPPFPSFLPEHVAALLEWVRDFTGGHIFPFVTLAQDLFVNRQLECVRGEAALSALVKSEIYSRSASMETIRLRCFEISNNAIFSAASNILSSGCHSSNDVDLLSK